jgi:hypothetical protein
MPDLATIRASVNAAKKRYNDAVIAKNLVRVNNRGRRQSTLKSYLGMSTPMFMEAAKRKANEKLNLIKAIKEALSMLESPKNNDELLYVIELMEMLKEPDNSRRAAKKAKEEEKDRTYEELSGIPRETLNERQARMGKNTWDRHMAESHGKFGGSKKRRNHSKRKTRHHK